MVGYRGNYLHPGALITKYSTPRVLNALIPIYMFVAN